jgi:uncharacterized membrane protein YqiK
LIIKDRYRVDIGAGFYVKILPESEMIEAASRSLGEKSFSAEGIKALVGEKLVSAMRSAAAQMELVELHENRRGFALKMKELVTDPLAQNGLGVEDVALFHLDQTDKAHLDPNNIFDAEGLRQITEQTNARMQERNEIEKNTEVAIKRKDVEAVRLKLELDREQAFAAAEQVGEVENHSTEQHADAERFRFAQELQTRDAEIGKDLKIREAELAREVQLVDREHKRQIAEIEREHSAEAAQRAKAIAILQEERKRIAEEEARLRADAQREEAEQAVATVTRTAEAEREKQVAVIRALNELEVAERKARATERLAEARFKDGEAMEPASHIDSIRVLDVKGLGGGGNGSDAPSDPVRRVYEALLGTGAALPLLRELLRFGQGSGVVEKLEESFPELKNLVELRSARDAS